MSKSTMTQTFCFINYESYTTYNYYMKLRLYWECNQIEVNSNWKNIT